VFDSWTHNPTLRVDVCGDSLWLGNCCYIQRDGLAKVRPEQNMTAREIVGLLEEMMDVKVQQYAETTMRPTPEVARLLQEKRETDRRRLDQIRAELIRILE